MWVGCPQPHCLYLCLGNVCCLSSTSWAATHRVLLHFSSGIHVSWHLATSAALTNCTSEAAGGLESPALLFAASACSGMLWMVWGTSQGGRAVFWPSACFLHTSTSGLLWRTGLLGWHMLCKGMKWHLSVIGILPMCLTLAGTEEIPANGSSLSSKTSVSPLRNSPETIFASTCLQGSR